MLSWYLAWSHTYKYLRGISHDRTLTYALAICKAIGSAYGIVCLLRMDLPADTSGHAEANLKQTFNLDFTLLLFEALLFEAQIQSQLPNSQWGCSAGETLTGSGTEFLKCTASIFSGFVATAGYWRASRQYCLMQPERVLLALFPKQSNTMPAASSNPYFHIYCHNILWRYKHSMMSCCSLISCNQCSMLSYSHDILGSIDSQLMLFSAPATSQFEIMSNSGVKSRPAPIFGPICWNWPAQRCFKCSD